MSGADEDAAPLELYVRLDKAGFNKLVGGEIVSLHTIRGQEVRLIPPEMTFLEMYEAIDDARAKVRGRA